MRRTYPDTMEPFHQWARSPLFKKEYRALSLTAPFSIAHGSYSQRTVLRLHHNGGVGEAPFVPYYPDSITEVEAWFAEIAGPGADLVAPTPPMPRVLSLAVDLLRHDLNGRALGLPLWRILKMANPAGKRGCRSIGIPADLDALANDIRLVSRQFGVIKLKLGSGNTAFDEAIVAKAREVAPSVLFFADVNGGWSPKEAAALLPRLQKMGHLFVEQPVSHTLGIDGWRELQSHLKSSTLPLFADESVQNCSDIESLSGLIQGVNIKLLKAGGLAGALRMLKAARNMRLQTLLGCMIESTVGVTAAAHLAGGFDWIDLDGHLSVADDDYEGLTYNSEGMLQLPAFSELGVRLKGEDGP